jgi:hypothetical protein
MRRACTEPLALGTELELEMPSRSGGCLCGNIRYEVAGQPVRINLCYCRFCQQATGSDYMLDAIFEAGSFRITSGQPRTYSHRSVGSGKHVHVHFCENCGTKTNLTFERFPTLVGVYAGTFDEPSWLDLGQETARQIYLNSAREGVVLAPGLRSFREHAMTNDGIACEAVVFEHPKVWRNE